MIVLTAINVNKVRSFKYYLTFSNKQSHIHVYRRLLSVPYNEPVAEHPLSHICVYTHLHTRVYNTESKS